MHPRYSLLKVVRGVFCLWGIHRSDCSNTYRTRRCIRSNCLSYSHQLDDVLIAHSPFETDYSTLLGATEYIVITL